MEIASSSKMDIYNNKYDDKASDLMIACQNNDIGKIDELLKENTSTSDRDQSGKVALHYCAENGTLELVEKLYEGDPSLLDHRDEEGYTPLTFAVIGGNEKVAEFLINKGADVNTVDVEKHSLVHWATVCGQKPTLEVVLKRGALVSLPDLHGAHPIHYATQLCETGDGLEILQLLLKHGADVNCADLEQRTPLLWAASCGSEKAFEALCDAGADKKCSDKDQLSSIHCAASRGHADMVDLILNRTVDLSVDAKDRNGCSPLFYAATLGYVDCTRTLLKNNAQANYQDKKLRTAAHCAAAKGQLATIKLLWQSGASFDLGNHRGDLPIHEAAQAGSIEVVEFLLLVNAKNLNARNHFGRTPLHLASANGDMELCKFLVEKGTNVDALMLSKNKIFTALDVADQKRHMDVVEYLQSLEAKKSVDLDESVVKAFKQSILVQIPEKKIEFIESMAQTEVPEKIDQSVEVEVHVQPEQEQELGLVHDGSAEQKTEEELRKSAKRRTKKSRRKAKSTNGQEDYSSDDEQSVDEDEKDMKSKGKSKSSSKSNSRNKHKKDKKTEENEDDEEGKTKSRKKKSKDVDSDEEVVSGSETALPESGSSVVSEPMISKEEILVQVAANGVEPKKRSKTKDGKQGKKSTKNRTLSIISEENVLNSKDKETSSPKTTSNKETLTEPLAELNLLNNARQPPNGSNFNAANMDNSSNKKQVAKKISVEQALFTDNLKNRPIDTHSHASLQVHNISRIRDTQSSAMSQNSSVGLYRSRHRNRYCETCNLSIPMNVNRYVEEKRIFQELANLKRMQIQYGKVQENILVRRLMEDFFRQYNIDTNGFHVETFHSWEQFLYDQLQKLYQQEQETIRVKRLQHHSQQQQASLFQKRLQERAVYGNRGRIDSLSKIYGTAPLPLQYARKQSLSSLIHLFVQKVHIF